MRQYDMNGPEGRGLVEIDPKTGKKLKVQSALADSLRNTGIAKTLRSTHERIEKNLEDAGKGNVTY